MPTLTTGDAISRQLALISISVACDNDAARGIVASVPEGPRCNSDRRHAALFKSVATISLHGTN